MSKLYQIKIYKSWGGRSQSGNWTNVYDVLSDMEIDDEGWPDKIAAFQSFEAGLHCIPVQFMRAVLSTMKPDKALYPKNLRVFELTGNGGRVISGSEQAVPLDICLELKKQVSYGRAGRLFLRGALITSDIGVGTDGSVVLQGVPITPGTVSNAYGFLNSLFGNNDFAWVLPTKAEIAAGTGDANTARVIHGVQVSSVAVNKRNHKFFNRARQGTGGTGPAASGG